MAPAIIAPTAPTPDLPSRGERYRLVVPNARTSPKIVRDFVATVLRAAGHGPLVDDARLCVSEVVSNAYCHTRSPRVQVDLALDRGEMTVYVTDDGPCPLDSATPAAPIPQPCAAMEESGRGLVLVGRLAARWGSTAHGGHTSHTKTVWFTLAAAP